MLHVITLLVTNGMKSIEPVCICSAAATDSSEYWQDVSFWEIFDNLLNILFRRAQMDALTDTML